MQPKKTLLSWSGGKDSAWALHTLRQDPAYNVAALLTTVNELFSRVAIHGFREELLDRQAISVGLPVWKIPLPYPCSNAEYESRMEAVCARAVREGFEAVAFGDLFLEEIRAYRIEHLAGTGLEPVFPIWGIPTDQLARQMVAAGLRARITCLDPRHLPASFCGRVFDAEFLNDLPPLVDPCGERGEFHSFAYAGPMFSQAISVEHTHNIEREGFLYGDLVPIPAPASP
ncbi:MAG: ATP-binding protein [Terriglobia bacterium]|nr:ATP-binding protein [Terriglobia bacterium]